MTEDARWGWIDGRLRPLLVSPEITCLEAAVDKFRESPRAPRHPVETGEDLRRLRHVIDLLELDFASRAASYAATEQYLTEGSVSPVDWIRHECHMSAHASETAVCAGEQLGQLPQSERSLEGGAIGFAHFALIARTARALRESPTAAPFDEAEVLVKAEASSVGRFRHDCAHIRHAADPAEVLRDHVDLVDARYLELQTRDDGALLLRGFLDPVGGATLRTALEPLARFDGHNDVRSRNKRLGDALVELSSHVMNAGSLPTAHGVRTHLQVTASIETLSGLLGSAAGLLEHSTPIPASTVQRLACDAGVTRILLDAKSAPVDVSRERRLPSPATWRALKARDKGCVWPACDRAVSWTSAHHVVHWANGGKTDLQNLVLLCHKHHWMVHEGGWQLARTQEGVVAKIPPLPARRSTARAPDGAAA